jgi:hypothetical protein
MDPAQWHFIQQQRQRDEAFAFLAWRDEQDRQAGAAVRVKQERDCDERARLRLERTLARRRGMVLCGVLAQGSMATAAVHSDPPAG